MQQWYDRCNHCLFLSTVPQVREVLESMCADHDPAVIPQLIEFMFRHTADIFEEAKVLADHCKRKAKLSVWPSFPSNDDSIPLVCLEHSPCMPFVHMQEIELEDVKLAVQTHANFTFLQPPSREVS